MSILQSALKPAIHAGYSEVRLGNWLVNGGTHLLRYGLVFLRKRLVTGRVPRGASPARNKKVREVLRHAGSLARPTARQRSSVCRQAVLPKP